MIQAKNRETRMQFVARVSIEVEIKNFERFDNVDFEYVEFSREMKQEVATKFDPKKFRLIFEISNIDPSGDGYSIVATASHRKRAKFEVIEKNDGVFYLKGEAEIFVPLKISDAMKKDYIASLIYCDLWKGSEDVVKLDFDPILISDFDFID
jgi:hypothetical protein